MLRTTAYCILALLALSAFHACQPDSVCRTRTKVQVGINMSHIVQTEVEGTTKNVEITTWDSITVQGVDNDSILYDNAKEVTTLFLYLRSDTTCTQYTLTWHEKTDTLTFFHTNYYDFISMACGCVVDHTLDSIAHANIFIDSIDIFNHAIDLNETRHVTLFLYEAEE